MPHDSLLWYHQMQWTQAKGALARVQQLSTSWPSSLQSAHSITSFLIKYSAIDILPSQQSVGWTKVWASWWPRWKRGGHWNKETESLFAFIAFFQRCTEKLKLLEFPFLCWGPDAWPFGFIQMLSPHLIWDCRQHYVFETWPASDLSYLKPGAINSSGRHTLGLKTPWPCSPWEVAESPGVFTNACPWGSCKSVYGKGASWTRHRYTWPSLSDLQGLSRILLLCVVGVR